MIFALLLAVAVSGAPVAVPPSLVFSNALPRLVDPGTRTITTNHVFEAIQRVIKLSDSVVGPQFTIHSSNPAWTLTRVESETPDICTISNGNFTVFGFPGTAQFTGFFTNSSGDSTTASASQEMQLQPINGMKVDLIALARNSLADAIVDSTVALTNGLTAPVPQGKEYNEYSSPMLYSFGVPPPDPKWSNWVYKRNPDFWLNGVRGLDAINVFPYQMQLTLITPRHCLTVEHMRGCGSNYMVCFVGTDNTIYWRRSLGTVAIGDRLRACILDQPVPIEPMTLIDGATLTNKIGILRRTDTLRSTAHSLPMIMFNQLWQAWVGDAVYATTDGIILHDDRSLWLNGWSWPLVGKGVMGGDSGSARCLVIDRRLYLLGVTESTRTEYTMSDISAINAALDTLSDQTGLPHNHVTVFDAGKYPSY
jgi:hypothetical protein